MSKRSNSRVSGKRSSCGRNVRTVLGLCAHTASKHHSGSRRGTLRPWPALTKLQALDLTANSFSGTLPSDYADLKQLKMLLLSANQLTGCAHLMGRPVGSKCMHCLGASALVLQEGGQTRCNFWVR